MKTTYKLLALLILATVSSCKEAQTVDYKHADNLKLLACDFPNGNLYKEAVYAFENDILNAYDSKDRNAYRAYSFFINTNSRNTFDIKTVASEHSLNIAKALKQESDLWSNSNEKTTLNTTHPLVDCIVNNIKDNAVKTSFNALLATNSLRKNVVLPTLSSNSRGILIDGSLKTYIALEYYFSQLFNVKLEELTNPNPLPIAKPAEPTSVNKVDLKKTPKQAVPIKDPHAGHNHD